jgi:hypothetical protein
MKYEVVKQTLMPKTDNTPAYMAYEVIGKNHGLTSGKAMCAKYKNHWKNVSCFLREQKEPQ